MTKWTTANMQDQTGKTVVVTGANSGLGYEFSLAMAQKGAHVVMACRNTTKGEKAANDIRKIHPAAALDVMTLDLASLVSIRQFAGAFNAKYNQLHILCNNAGVMHLPETKTADGFEMQFGTNHLGHFALTGLLLETILATDNARIINVSSGLHHPGKIEFDNLQSEKGYNRNAAYSNSKLANLLFTYELQRRLEAAQITHVISVGTHPGYVATNLQYAGARMEGNPLRGAIYRVVNTIAAGDVKLGVYPFLYAATENDVNGCDYIGRDGFMNMRGYPIKEKSSDRSYDEAVAKQLWEASEQLTGVKYHFPQMTLS